MTNMEIAEFGSEDLDNRLAEGPQYAEALPFGAILLDQMGNILRYNSAEGFISGRSPEDVIGKNFFNDVAPCAKGRELYGAFSKGVADGQINKLLDYTFDYKMEKARVRIHLKSEDAQKGIWMFIKRT